MVYAFKVYESTGFLSLNKESGKIELNCSKTNDVLTTFEDCFLRILAAEDAEDGAALEGILFGEMAPETPFIRKVLGLVAAANRSDGSGASVRTERNCTCHPTWSLPKCSECAVPVP